MTNCNSRHSRSKWCFNRWTTYRPRPQPKCGNGPDAQGLSVGDDQLKMPYALWTRGAVAELIEYRFGNRLPVRTMGLYLARWGFTPQRPIHRAYEQSPAAVKKWLEEDHPAIAERAKAEGVSRSRSSTSRATALNLIPTKRPPPKSSRP
jgi:winged helix-turn-helix protein